jgi:hypothetical protein
LLTRPLAFAAIAAVAAPVGFLLTSIVGPPFLYGFSFGALLAGYLWFCHGVQSPGRLAGLVVVSGAAFIAALLSVMVFQAVVPELFEAFQTAGSNWGPGPTPFLLAGILGGAILSVTFLVIMPGRSKSGEIATYLVLCTAAAGAFGLIGAIAVEQTRTFASMLPLFVIWQSGMAFVLAAVAERSAGAAISEGEVEAVPAAPPREPLSPGSLAIFGAMMALSFLVFAWVIGRNQQAKTFKESEDRKNAAWLAEAPSRDNLPSLREQPLEQTLVPSVRGMARQARVIVKRESAALGTSPGQASPPDSVAYHASYSGLADGSVSIWQYPTREWARYQTRHLVGVAIRPVFGQHVLDSDLEYYWFSDDKMIRISGTRPAVNPLLEAYLQKYPSGVDPAFPLFRAHRQ